MDTSLYDEILDAVRTFRSLTSELRRLAPDDDSGSDEEPPNLGPVAQR